MPISSRRPPLAVCLALLILPGGLGASRAAASSGRAAVERVEERSPGRDGEQESERESEREREREREGRERVEDSAAGARLERALERALHDPKVLASLHLVVTCQHDGKVRSMQVFGSGVGIWEGRRQFRLSGRQLEAMVRLLLKGGFLALEPSYGEEEDEDEPMTVETCELGVAVAGATKQVTQRARGEQSPVLPALAARLLALGDTAAEAGVSATNLRDALDKLAGGELAPETLSFTAQRRAESGQVSTEPGFLLRLAGQRATVLPGLATGGWGEALEVELSPSAVRALAGELVASGLEQWPVNLYAVDYVSLDVRVLDHGKSVQARQFSGMDPTGRPQQQAQLARVLTQLEAIARQALAEGRPVAPGQ